MCVGTCVHVCVRVCLRVLVQPSDGVNSARTWVFARGELVYLGFTFEASTTPRPWQLVLEASLLPSSTSPLCFST